MRIVRFVAVVAVLSIGLQGTAFAGANHTIAATSGLQFVDPVTNGPLTNAIQGEDYQWQNTGTVGVDPNHQSASDGYDGTSGPSLWKTSPITPGTTLPIPAITTAGTFTYHCTIHPFMHGQIVIPILISPLTVKKGVLFTVTWATGPIPSGFNVDVQMNAPVRTGHKRRWVTKFPDETTNTSGDITPVRPGVYRFRARLQNGTGGASLYSPIAAISVTKT